MGEIIICPKFTRPKGPVIFLAGPIQGAPDWQGEAIEILKRKTSASIASPRRAGTFKEGLTDEDFEIQVRWEHHYLDIAEKTGVILFWLAKESTHFCERAYAQTSRFELGWKLGAMADICGGKYIVTGIEPGFSNEHYLRVAIPMIVPSVYPIYSTLEETCSRAVEIINAD